MTNPLKVQIISGNHSAGRGVGVYAENLISSLSINKQIILTDQEPDLIHYTYFDLFQLTLKVNPQIPTIVTIHDLTPLVMANRYPKGIRGSLKLFLQWLSLRKVSAIITDSENSKKDIHRYFWIPEEKIFVTPLAVNKTYNAHVSAKQQSLVREKYHLPDRFILTVAAGPNPNKNLPNLAEVTERIGIPLVIVGREINQKVTKPVPAELIDLVRLEVYQHLYRLTAVPNEELNVLFGLATLYVQASFYEGFGIPLLEAMTKECLIVSSRSSSLPEVYHPDTITFNPKSLKSMEKSIKKALNLSEKSKAILIQKNKLRSQDFSWTKTASQTVAVYQHLYEQIS